MTLATRTYTTGQIKPLLANDQRRQGSFLPQQVPAYAATEVFNHLHEHYPEYAYKEATLNPTNLRDRAADWEADVINRFRNKNDQHEYTGERMTPDGGRSLFLARPIRIQDKACLECHSVPGRASVSMIRQYGSNNGSAGSPQEIVGAQVVSVPMSVPFENADRALKTLAIYLVLLGIITICILTWFLSQPSFDPWRSFPKWPMPSVRVNCKSMSCPSRGTMKSPFWRWHLTACIAA